MITEVEQIEGEKVVEDIASFLHGVVGMRLGRYLDNYVDANALGYVTNAQTSFRVIGSPPTRLPHVAFVRLEKMPELLDSEVPFAPDLAVEVISSNDDWKANVDKAKQYLQAGTQLVWVVDPYTKSVFVFRDKENLNFRIVRGEDDLDGEEVVPGFKLKVSALFKQIKTPNQS